MSWVFETMIAATLLMALVLLIRRPVAELFGPRLSYLLWLAPALRMVMPPLPSGWSLVAATPLAEIPMLTDALVPAEAYEVGQATAPVFAAPMDWVGLGLAFWIAGAVIFFVGHAFAYADFSRRAQRRGTGLMAADGIPVIASTLVPSPVALGVFTQSILVPVDFLWRYDAAERRLALAHELVHHRRHDLIANVAGLAILSLHWWNPVAHFAFRAFRLDQEAACDAVVLSSSTAEDRRAYGNALYKSAAGTMPLAMCALGSASQLKARLRLIARGSHNAMPLRGVAVALFGIGAGVVMTASTISVAAPVGPVPASPMLAIEASDIAAVPAEARLALVETELAEIEAEMGRVEAEGGRIEATAAQIEADAADSATRMSADAADAASRAAAEAADDATRIGADAAREAAQSARNAAEVARKDARHALANAGKCRDGSRMAAEVIDRGRDTMRIMMCGKVIHDQAKVRDEVVSGLREARDDVARDRSIPERIRSSVVASLDRQLAEWRSGARVRPEPLAPPAMPRLPDGAEVPAPPLPPKTLSACPAGTRNTHVVAYRQGGQNVASIRCDGRAIVARVSR